MARAKAKVIFIVFEGMDLERILVCWTVFPLAAGVWLAPPPAL